MNTGFSSRKPSLKDYLSQELELLEREGLRRSFKALSSSQGREIILDGKKILNFCSNDYLGLAADPRLSVAAQALMQTHGFGAGASRLVCGNFDVHQALEEDLAQFKHAPSALVFSSGYMANAGIIPALVGRGDAVFSDRLNHASIIDGAVLSRAKLYRYPHKDMDALESMLRQAKGNNRRLIVTDTVFSMDGDTAPLKEMASLAGKFDAWLMVDEAHAFGVLGASGGGLVEALGLGAQVDVQMGTLSKAAGTYGAYAAGSVELKEYLINTARSLIFTTALPAAMAAASRCALSIMQAEPWRRQKVFGNAGRLRQALRSLGLDTMGSETPIIPVMVGDAARAVALSRKLQARGIFVSAIRPPTVPVHTARLRVSVTAAHTDDDLDRCVEAFKDVL